jgi:hypothetical protein
LLLLARWLLLGVVFLLQTSSSRFAWGDVIHFPTSLPAAVLSESLPTAFAPNAIDVSDFDLIWVGDLIPGVELNLIEGSMQWVRVLETLVLPRARLSILVKKSESGLVSNGGFSQSFQFDGTDGSVEIPIALISGEGNSIHLQLQRGGNVFRGQVQVRFHPRPEIQNSPNSVSVDPSCSPFRVSAESLGKNNHDWAYIGCRLVRVRGQDFRTPSLEVLIYWDHGKQSIQIGGLETPSTMISVWSFRLRAEGGPVSLQAEEHEIRLQYRLPKKLHNHALSMGIGPYSFNFKGGGEDLSTVVAMPTLYASHFITDSMRIVEFGALALESHFFTDLGLYLHFEQFRFLDRRLSMNLLIGGHAVGFKSQGQFYLVGSLPQGFEFVFTDFLTRAQNLVLGAFIYPPISGNAYYNGWIRWGNQIFAEVNYIAWQAEPNQNSFRSSSVGVTLGFPLLRFW